MSGTQSGEDFVMVDQAKVASVGVSDKEEVDGPPTDAAATSPLQENQQPQQVDDDGSPTKKGPLRKLVVDPVQTVSQKTKAAVSNTLPHRASPADSKKENENEEKPPSNDKKQETIVTKVTEGSQKAIKTVGQGTRKVVGKFKRSPRGGVVEEAMSAETTKAPVDLSKDEPLQAMNVVISKKLPGVSVKDFYETCWRASTENSKKADDEQGDAFYQDWLQETGKSNIQVSPWETTAMNADDPANETTTTIVGDWDDEEYDCQRRIQYSFDRKTAVYTGTAQVTQTQYGRFRHPDRCVISTTMKMAGTPFCDAFSVQLRWVATRVGQDDLLVQVGLFVLFVKQVFVASKIRSATTEETTKTQLDLFRSIKKKLVLFDDSNETEPPTQDLRSSLIVFQKERVQPVLANAASHLVLCFPFLPKSIFRADDRNDVEIKMDGVKEKIRLVRALPRRADPEEQEEQKRFVLSEFAVAQEALNGLLARELGMDRGPPQPAPATSSPISAVFTPISNVFGKMVDGVRSLSPIHKKEPMIEVLPDPDPDAVLEGMNVTLSKVIQNASIQDFYDLVLSEKEKDPKSSFYYKWMEGTDRTNISIEPWTVSSATSKEKRGKAPPREPTPPIVDDWSKETFQRKRIVKANFQKANFMKQALPTAVGTQIQEQYCRSEGNRLVFAATNTFQGVAFAESFTVHVRWVVSKMGLNDLSVKVGTFVLLSGRILVESKLRAGVTKEGMRLQVDLFRKIRAEFGRKSESDAAPPEVSRAFTFEDSEVQAQISNDFCGNQSPFRGFLPKVQKLLHVYPNSMVVDDPDLEEDLEKLEEKLRAVGKILEDEHVRDNPEDMNFILSELGVVHEALDNVVVGHGSTEGGTRALADASFQ